MKEIFKNNKNYSPQQFLGSFQSFFFYLDNASNKSEDNIDNVLKSIPEYVNFSNDFKNFFKGKRSHFKVNQSMNIYLNFEDLCFEQLCLKLNSKFKVSIDDKSKSLIENKMKNFKYNNEFPKALRRYISRYLVGINNEAKIENNKLFPELIKSDLWGLNLTNMNEIKKFFDDEFKDFDITVSKSFSFYDLIGIKDKNPNKIMSINPSITKEEDVSDSESSNEEDENGVKIKGSQKFRISVMN